MLMFKKKPTKITQQKDRNLFSSKRVVNILTFGAETFETLGYRNIFSREKS